MATSIVYGRDKLEETVTSKAHLKATELSIKLFEEFNRNLEV